MEIPVNLPARPLRAPGLVSARSTAGPCDSPLLAACAASSGDTLAVPASAPGPAPGPPADIALNALDNGDEILLTAFDTMLLQE